jgi:alginate O-acetyltransferase complex protein AlgI
LPQVANAEVGLTLVAIGLFKKIVLADNLSPLANLVFLGADNRQDIAPSMAWFGAFAYYCQLYFDFSGYSDMAVGTARVLGVVFPINFYSPLKAVGIVDFYRRWHITLTRVIARFFYMPLSISGARFAAQRRWGALPSRMAALWLPLTQFSRDRAVAWRPLHFRALRPHTWGLVYY